MNSPVREFVEFLLVGAEHCTREEAWARLEGTRLMALLQENVFIHSRTVERPACGAWLDAGAACWQNFMV